VNLNRTSGPSRGPSRAPCAAALAALLAAALPAASLGIEASEKPAAAAPAIRLLYTVNNLGYTDTCG
jgi:hypothetical protein